ncbi:MAG TPA: glycosyltransferase [Gemmatimonadaceae bacterium]
MKLVIQNTARVWGGNEKSLATLARGLSERGHEVVVSCAKGTVSERLRGMGIRITHFRPRGLVDFVSGASFAVWLKAERPDAVLLTSWSAIPWGALAAAMAGIDRVIVRQGIVRTVPAAGPHAYALRHWVDQVITNAPEIKAEWERSIPGFPRDHVHVVMNAVPPIAGDRKSHRRALRREIGVDDSTVVISAAGIISRRKNFELLIDAFAIASPANARIVIVGDGLHRAALEKYAATAGVSDWIHFLGARDNAASIIAGSDMFVLSSRNEGMANVMLEAMAARVPVIAADISGVSAAIGPASDRRDAGWIYPADDSRALAAIIERVIAGVRSGDNALESRVAEASWRIDNWFSESRMLDQSERILFA